MLHRPAAPAALAAGVLAGALAGVTSAWGAATASLDFDRTFVQGKAPARSHYVATYRLGADEHRLEVWRDGETALHRLTDGRLETFVSKARADDEWSMVVLDRDRKIRTDVRRTNLMRVGHITDWFALSRSLTRPVGQYRLDALPPGAAPHVATVAPCRWYSLVQGERETRICWSPRQQLAMAVTDAHGGVLWAIRTVDAGPLPASAFAIDDRGFVRNDANADIQAD